MAISDARILELYRERMSARSDRLRRMERVREAYSFELVVPLPEVDSIDEPGIANIINLGVDGISQRVASVMPSIVFPQIGDGPTARRKAATRRDVAHGWWYESAMSLKQLKRARHFAAYASSIVDVKPDPKHAYPCFEIRDPLTAFAGEHDGETTVCDIVFAYRVPAAKVQREWGVLPLGAKIHDTVLMLEYVDAEERVMLAVGQEAAFRNMTVPWSGFSPVRLARVETRLERCPVVVADRAALGDPVGQFDGMIGPYMQMAMLQALEYHAVKRGVFPDVWIEGRGSRADVVREADGLQGIVGITDGSVRVVNEAPGYMTNPAIDRLERNMRVTGRVPAEFGGESTTNVRTGRRGDSIFAAVVDFAVREAQVVLGRAMEEELRIAMDTDRAWFGTTTKTVWVGTGDSIKPKEYVPASLWERGSEMVRVSYSNPGVDANGLIIGLGQRVGMGTLSKRSAMEMDPLVSDPEREHDFVVAEGLNAALLAGLQAQAQSGQIPPSDVARIVELVRSDQRELAEAVMQAQREAQERQARQAPAGSPETMPGLAQPGMGAEQPPAPVMPPSDGQRNLASLLGRLRLIGMQSPQEMAGQGAGG